MGWVGKLGQQFFTANGKVWRVSRASIFSLLLRPQGPTLFQNPQKGSLTCDTLPTMIRSQAFRTITRQSQDEGLPYPPPEDSNFNQIRYFFPFISVCLEK